MCAIHLGHPADDPCRCGPERITRCRTDGAWSAASAHKIKIWNHPRQSHTINACCPYFPVFSSPTATVEVVGNTGNTSSEKVALYHSTPSPYQDKRHTIAPDMGTP